MFTVFVNLHLYGVWLPEGIDFPLYTIYLWLLQLLYCICSQNKARMYIKHILSILWLLLVNSYHFWADTPLKSIVYPLYVYCISIYGWYIRLGKFHHDLTVLPYYDHGNWIRGTIPKMAELFRFANYSNLTRFMTLISPQKPQILLVKSLRVHRSVTSCCSWNNSMWPPAW